MYQVETMLRFFSRSNPWPREKEAKKKTDIFLFHQFTFVLCGQVPTATKAKPKNNQDKEKEKNWNASEKESTQCSKLQTLG